SCAAGMHCEPGGGCGEGACVPDETVPDVSGIWLTRHDYRIRDALPFTVQEVFKALRLMDQTLLGQLTIPGLPGWLQEILNAFVARLLQQYLPGWVQQLIHLSDDFATILGNLRSEGAMRLTRAGDAVHLMGVLTAGEFQCIEEATECAPGMGCIVDCDGLAGDVESATDGIVDAATVQALCGRGMRAVGRVVAQALARAWPLPADTLDFSGSASGSGVADDPG